MRTYEQILCLILMLYYLILTVKYLKCTYYMYKQAVNYFYYNEVILIDILKNNDLEI